MKGVLPLSGLVLAGALLGGCQDNSKDVEKLQADMVAQQNSFDEANDRWASERDTMRAEINDLKKQLGTLQGKDGKPAQPVAERIKELEGRLEEAENAPKNDPDTKAKLDALSRKIDNLKDEAVEAARVEAAKVGGGKVSAEDLAKAMAEEQAKDAPTKNLNEALDRLEISQGEKEQVKQSIIDAKKQILETLEVPTADGRNLAEELIDTMIKIQNGDAKQSDAMTIFAEIAAQKVPGDIEGRTYMDAINAIKATTKEDIGRILTEKDQAKLTKAHEDWTDFEVGDGDPWGELYMERVQKYNETHPAKDD